MKEKANYQPILLVLYFARTLIAKHKEYSHIN